MSPHLYIDVRMQNHSGIGTYIRNVVGRLLPQLPAGSFTLLGPKGPGAMTAEQGEFREYHAPIYSLREQWDPLWLGISKNDVVWSPHYNMPLLLRCQRLVTVHDLLHLAMPEFAGGIAKQTYARLFFSKVAARAEKVICVSQATADELVRFTGIAAEKIAVIHNGVAPFWRESTALRPPLDGPYFLFVGNVKPHKNLRRLIAAMSLFAEEFPQHRLVIVGKREGFISGDTDAIREAESMPGKIAFTGYVDDQVLKSYLQAAEALVFPSLYEGFGLPPLEAMAAGCPVIVSNLAVHREICGSAAVFCDPHSVTDLLEKMRRVAILTPGERAELIGAGRVQARRFDWDHTAAETLGVLQEILSPGNAHAG